MVGLLVKLSFYDRHVSPYHNPLILTCNVEHWDTPGKTSGMTQQFYMFKSYNRKCQDYVYIRWEYYVENKALLGTWK